MNKIKILFLFLLVNCFFKTTKGEIIISTTKGELEEHLFAAIDEGNLELVRSLLDRGANLSAAQSKYCCTPLIKALDKGRLDISSLLIDRGADFNVVTIYYGETALHKMCRCGDIWKIKFLLDRGANVNMKMANGMTPLHTACRAGDRDKVQLLLERGAIIDMINNKGKTPLHYACFNKDKALIELLLNSGATINKKSFHGITPLHIACRESSKDVVGLLLENIKLTLDVKVEIHGIDEYGRTPLHNAFYRKNVEIVKLLLKEGACLNAVVPRGRVISNFLSSAINEKWYRPLFVSLINYEFKIYSILLRKRFEKAISDTFKTLGQFKIDSKSSHGLKILKMIADAGLDLSTTSKILIDMPTFEDGKEDEIYRFILKNPDYKFSKTIFDKLEVENYKYKSYRSLDIIKFLLENKLVIEESVSTH